MNGFEQQKKMDKVMKFGILVLVVLALIAAVAFFLATKDVGQAIFFNATI